MYSQILDSDSNKNKTEKRNIQEEKYVSQLETLKKEEKSEELRITKNRFALVTHTRKR